MTKTHTTIRLGEETKNGLRDYMKYLEETGGVAVTDNYQYMARIGICGNTAHFGFNERIYSIFTHYMKFHDITFSQRFCNERGIMLKVDRSPMTEELGFHKGIYTECISKDVYFFQDYPSRLKFIRWVLACSI